MWLLYCPSPQWGGEENGKKKGKLVGRDKGSLKEQQTKRTVATIILIGRITQNKQRKCTEQLSPSDALCAPELRFPSTWAAPPPRTQHDCTWYPIPCFVSPVWVSGTCCVPSQLMVKINPTVAGPRTQAIKKYKSNEMIKI